MEITSPRQEPEVFAWLRNASDRGGSFVKYLALAALYADYQNYPILRPVILKMKEKYPAYSSTTTDPRQGQLL